MLSTIAGIYDQAGYPSSPAAGGHPHSLPPEFHPRMGGFYSPAAGLPAGLDPAAAAAAQYMAAGGGYDAVYKGEFHAMLV